MGCHALLQGIFLTQGSNLCLTSLALASRFFTTSATWEAQTRPQVPIILFSRTISLSHIYDSLNTGFILLFFKKKSFKSRVISSNETVYFPESYELLDSIGFICFSKYWPFLTFALVSQLWRTVVFVFLKKAKHKYCCFFFFFFSVFNDSLREVSRAKSAFWGLGFALCWLRSGRPHRCRTKCIWHSLKKAISTDPQNTGCAPKNMHYSSHILDLSTLSQDGLGFEQ